MILTFVRRSQKKMFEVSTIVDCCIVNFLEWQNIWQKSLWSWKCDGCVCGAWKDWFMLSIMIEVSHLLSQNLIRWKLKIFRIKVTRNVLKNYQLLQIFCKHIWSHNKSLQQHCIRRNDTDKKHIIHCATRPTSTLSRARLSFYGKNFSLAHKKVSVGIPEFLSSLRLLCVAFLLLRYFGMLCYGFVVKGSFSCR